MATIRPLYIDTADGRIKQMSPNDALDTRFPTYLRNDGRLSLHATDSLPAADQLAKTTLYYGAASQGGTISLYTGSVWRVVALPAPATSVAVPSAANQMFDVFAYLNGSTVEIETLNWTNDTTRATAIAGQDGMAVKSGDPTRLYVGTCRTTASSGQTEDSAKKRLIYNRFNRWPRNILVQDAATSWTYTTATYRQANANTLNQFELVCGFTDVFIDITAIAKHQSGTDGLTRLVGLGFDSTTTNSGTQYSNQAGAASVQQMSWSRFLGQRTDRFYQIFMWNEFSTATGTTTWQGLTNSGIEGWVLI